MRFRIPNHAKETVSIVRYDAEDGTEMTIAIDVVCMVSPTNAVVSGAADVSRDGVDMSEERFEVLLAKPNEDILEGDALRRPKDGREYEIRRIRAQGTVMKLLLGDDRVL